ncbi:MAG: hypothetical protein QGI50_07890 [Dehalococcoidia bacterium]|nr:hypothetical protein [Dehalococcoidia bacterium]MDP7200867.1 hypothetical protein [Dehalococcoidia bacterium]MDP7510774.1 hypothetical protein [Dehalococcoidia bacterium]HJN85773.1 hypothetical protein [Dehalococcoidia bacterium]
MTKSFMMMLTVFVVLGVSFGGTFIGGVALGKSQGNDSSADSSPLRPAAGLQQQGSDQSGQGFQRANASPEELARLREQFQSGELGPDDLAQIRQRFQSGEVSPDDLSQIRQQFQSGEVSPDDLSQIRQRFGQGFGGRGALTGSVNQVEGNTVTVETAQGAQQATINDETVIQRFAVAELEDLQAGAQVAVIGQLGEDGLVVARLIYITPEGAASFFDGSFFSGERPRRDRSAGGGDSSQLD